MNKPTALLAAAWLAAAPLFSQNKGASPLANPQSAIANPQSTRAVVIGISNYQDEAIPDLRFADRDAEAFANFLRSPAGGSLDADHLKLLANEAATTAQFDAALGWLIDECKPGDQAIIYFSGHGDVETKTRSQQGFLLCWDSPPQAYVSGAYPIFFLKEVVSTLSLTNKSRVIVITDACRSGKLAGNNIGGAQLTSQNLAQQFANEIKILSCQPNEYSIEGEQWGGGRGAFSFHLLDGLYGMADGNSDASVSLFEIGRYLEDLVTTEVAPVSQVPMVVGNRAEKLAQVDPKLLAALRAGRVNQMTILAAIESRGLEEEVLAGVDSTTREQYYFFKKALKDKRLIEPDEACAETVYTKLAADPRLARLHATMRRNYAAALQDDAQQELNTMLKTGLSKELLRGRGPADVYGAYPRLLDRAAELLGPDHYMYATLQARRAFFLGEIEPKEAKNYFCEALRWQPDMPQALAEMIGIWSPTERDSAEAYAQRAMAAAPNWVVPYIRLSRFYYGRVGDFDKGERLLNQAGELDSTSALVWYSKGRFYDYVEEHQKAIQWLEKAVSSSGEGVCFNCALYHLGDSHLKAGQYEKAETILLQAVKLDSTYRATLNRLGKAYWLQHKFEDAKEAFKKEIRLAPNEQEKSMAYNELGNMYSTMNREPEAIEHYNLSLKADSSNLNGYYNLASMYRQTKQYDEAEKYAWGLIRQDSTLHGYLFLGQIYADRGQLAQADAFARKGLRLALREFLSEAQGYYASVMALTNQPAEAFEALEKALAVPLDTNFDWLQSDPDFAKLRALPEWKPFLKKHFPDKVKD